MNTRADVLRASEPRNRRHLDGVDLRVGEVARESIAGSGGQYAGGGDQHGEIKRRIGPPGLGVPYANRSMRSSTRVFCIRAISG